MINQVAVLGATGSIGDSTLAVIRKHPDKFKVFALSAHGNVEKISQLAQELKPRHVVITKPESYPMAKQLISNDHTSVHFGA